MAFAFSNRKPKWARKDSDRWLAERQQSWAWIFSTRARQLWSIDVWRQVCVRFYRHTDPAYDSASHGSELCDASGRVVDNIESTHENDGYCAYPDKLLPNESIRIGASVRTFRNAKSYSGLCIQSEIALQKPCMGHTFAVTQRRKTEIVVEPMYQPVCGSEVFLFHIHCCQRTTVRLTVLPSHGYNGSLWCLLPSLEIWEP